MEKWLKTAFNLAFASWIFGSGTSASPLNAEFRIQETLGFDQSSKDLEPNLLGDFQTTQSSLRLKTEQSQGPWSGEAHLLIAANYSQDWQEISSGLPPFLAQPLFDLETTAFDGKRGEMTLRIDRASINYTADRYTVKFGRQALTWGNGKIFNPMDRFDPFSPQAQDTSYKPGADMLYLQRLFDSGADLQLIYLPRKSIQKNRIDDRLSSLAAKYLFSAGSWQWEFLAAEDWNDEIVGGSAVGPLGPALWSTDIISTHFAESGSSLALTTNLQSAWTWKGMPFTGFIEYAHNGIGLTDPSDTGFIPPALLERISRGQYFNTGRDYIGIGLSSQWNPLFTLAPSAIFNLHDQSGIVLVNVQWNASNRDNLVLGLQAPFGRTLSEYGSSDNNTLVYFRWERFF